MVRLNLIIIIIVIFSLFFTTNIFSVNLEMKTNSTKFINVLMHVSNSTHLTTTSSNDLLNCSQPSIDDFPVDLFTQSERQWGAILLHFFFAFYLLVAIMKVCDDYFMSSLEIIGERLNLDQDVSGATFMAIGSSAPEVFISLIGVFASDSDPGLSAVVGSAIFNILFVIGICGLLISNSSKLRRWPFFRDSFFYCISIFTLLLVGILFFFFFLSKI